MRDDMTVEDAINFVGVPTCDLATDANEGVRKLVSAASRLASHVEEQALELERERARRQGRQCETGLPDGH